MNEQNIILPSTLFDYMTTNTKLITIAYYNDNVISFATFKETMESTLKVSFSCLVSMHFEIFLDSLGVSDRE